jgi:kynurenine formamidase
MNMRLEMADHTGTHLDGLNHVSIGNRLYNGYTVDETLGVFGTSKLGMEKTPPIFTRGVLVDVATSKRVTTLDSGYSITSNDIKSALKEKNAEIRKGDAVLVATGWDRLWMSNNQKFNSPCPGIDLSAARWIAERGASIVGSDTWQVEVVPLTKSRELAPIHQFLLTKNGIRLIENLKLEELQRDGVTEFLFVCLPLRIKGGSGSPVTPLAVT